MNIALPILLLVFGGLSFWVLNESNLKWYFKTVCITTFCVFTIIFWSSIHTFLGWPAMESDVPEKVVIHWVIIKEPNKFTKSNGRIYVLAESMGEAEASFLARFFGYKKEKIEPRLYGLEYSRNLHEQLEKGIIPKLKMGQPVVGRLKKAKPKLREYFGTSRGNKNGGGSDHRKPER